MSAGSTDNDDAILGLLGRQVTHRHTANRSYLVLPSLSRPRWILALENRAVAAASMRLYAPASRFGRLAKSAIAFCLRYGIMPGHVITVEQGSESSFLQEIRLRVGLPASDFFVALSLGTPGANRKCTLQLMRANGDSYAYVKLAAQSQPKLSLQREAHLLRTLALQGFVNNVPCLLDVGEADGFDFLVQSAGFGTPSGTEILPAHWRFLARLLSTATTTVVDHVEGAGQLTVRLQRHFPLLPADDASTLSRALAHLRSAAILPMHGAVVHGDFAPWNMMLQGKGLSQSLFVYDWEHGVPCGLPLVDAIHFQMQTGILVRRASPPWLIKSMMHELASDAAKEYLVEASIATSMIPTLIIAYLADAIVTSIEIEMDKASDLQRGRFAVLRHMLTSS